MIIIYVLKPQAMDEALKDKFLGPSPDGLKSALESFGKRPMHRLP
ncbi:hypothetical protein [Ferroplasma sp.]